MLVNSNVYTFMSGIFVSLSINIFTNLCFEKRGFFSTWHMYFATIVLLLASALCMYLAAKLSRFQNYIIEKHITEYENKREIVLDAAKDNKTKWIITYACTVCMVIVGAILLVFNFIS